MFKEAFFLVTALMIFGAGCGPSVPSRAPSTGQNADGSDEAPPAKENETYISCSEGGHPTEYFIVSPERGIPINASQPRTLAKVAGDARCFPAEQFDHVSSPDKCGAQHYHGDKTATDGSTLPDLAPQKCGVATTDQVALFTVYELEGDGPRDAAPPTLYGEEIDPDEAICGPDITEGLLGALKRIHSRMQSIPDSDYGAVDGAFFLERNGNNIDFRAHRVKNEKNAPVCPSNKCTAPDGQGTVTLCGQCVMEHIANDMMYGFVSNQLGVPWDVQKWGAHYAEFSSYGSLDPVHSQAAYAMGNKTSEAMGSSGELSIGDFCDRLNATKFDGGNAFTLLGEEQSFLKDCRRPPPECKAKTSKDFSTQGWNFSK